MSRRVLFRVIGPDGVTKSGQRIARHGVFEAVPDGTHVSRWLQAGRVERVTIHICRCRSEPGALCCEPCYSKLPAELVAEVRAAYFEKQGSARHHAAVRACVLFLAGKGGSK